MRRLRRRAPPAPGTVRPAVRVHVAGVRDRLQQLLRGVPGRAPQLALAAAGRFVHTRNLSGLTDKCAQRMAALLMAAEPDAVAGLDQHIAHEGLTGRVHEALEDDLHLLVKSTKKLRASGWKASSSAGSRPNQPELATVLPTPVSSLLCS